MTSTQSQSGLDAIHTYRKLNALTKPSAVQSLHCWHISLNCIQILQIYSIICLTAVYQQQEWLLNYKITQNKNAKMSLLLFRVVLPAYNLFLTLPGTNFSQLCGQTNQLTTCNTKLFKLKICKQLATKTAVLGKHVAKLSWPKWPIELICHFKYTTNSEHRNNIIQWTNSDRILQNEKYNTANVWHTMCMQNCSYDIQFAKTSNDWIRRLHKKWLTWLDKNVSMVRNTTEPRHLMTIQIIIT